MDNNHNPSDHRMPHIIPVGVYLGFKVWMYYIWMTHVAALVSPLTTVAILLATIPIWVTYIRTWRSDPGVISLLLNERFSAFINIFDSTE